MTSQQVKAWRLGKKLTQAEAAKALGIPQSELARIEMGPGVKGGLAPPANFAEKIKKANPKASGSESRRGPYNAGESARRRVRGKR